MFRVLLPAIMTKPKQPRYDHAGDFGGGSRYVAIGFDDFRITDFSRIIPLFERYGYKATFNKIIWNSKPTWIEKLQIKRILLGGHEIGDHTIMHSKYIFDEPMFNGQNPEHPEGGQIPFPTDEQMSKDRGDGKNVFGIPLTQTMAETFRNPSWRPPVDEITTWGGVKSQDCQAIRSFFSVMFDTSSGLIELLDELSNKYLGTNGTSRGSWDDQSQCYTGGIFTGCKTSANHEIWEKYLEVVSLYYKDIVGDWFQPKTWSFPGSKLSWCYFEKEGNYYYDNECAVYRNNLAKMKSSLTGEKRSWVDCLRHAGYTVSHDSQYPSRMDGFQKPAMAYQLICNASFSRKDAVVYSSQRVLSFTKISKEYPKRFFSGKRSREAAMYDVDGSFRTAIETWRMNMASGIVWGEVIDSNQQYSFLAVLEGLLKYCQKTGVNVITKQEAFDLCFNKKHIKGNLLYNTELRNTAKEFLLNSDVPTNPDGYDGDCYVKMDGFGEKVLVIQGITRYVHMGIPYGKRQYTMMSSGKGEVVIYVLKNNNAYNLERLQIIDRIRVNSEVFEQYSLSFSVSQSAECVENQVCERLGERIMGLVFDYSGGLEVKCMSLNLI